MVSRGKGNKKNAKPNQKKNNRIRDIIYGSELFKPEMLNQQVQEEQEKKQVQEQEITPVANETVNEQVKEETPNRVITPKKEISVMEQFLINRSISMENTQYVEHEHQPEPEPEPVQVVEETSGADYIHYDEPTFPVKNIEIQSEPEQEPAVQHNNQLTIEPETVQYNIESAETNTENENKTINIPKLVFIVPYRNRENHKNVFEVMMRHVMEDYADDYYEIYYAHQTDSRPFNRGAMKNLGFLAIKDKYPNDYQDITFVFNDVDTVPTMKGLINYETTHGIIKHFYGFPYALGGIFSITGQDFEMINGFPCYWSWGYEDNVINSRATKYGLTIDRSQFYKIGNHAILQTVDNFVKSVNRKHRDAMKTDDFSDGLHSIMNISYDLDIRQKGMINFRTFEPHNKLSNEKISPYNLLQNRYMDGAGRTLVHNKPQSFEITQDANINNKNNNNRLNTQHIQYPPANMSNNKQTLVEKELINQLFNNQVNQKQVQVQPIQPLPSTQQNFNVTKPINSMNFMRRGLQFMNN